MFIDRYSRQTLFRPIGQEGQSKLEKSRVAVVGMGALGTISATQLVRAGVGFVRLIDRDIIEPSNLQRQSLYDEVDAAFGQAKAIASAEKLRKANGDIEIDPVVADLNSTNAETYLSDVDVIVDATDNFQVRYLMNDVSVKHGIPFAYGGAVSSYGTTAFLRPGVTPCLVCLLGSEAGAGGQDTCDTVGVIAPIVSVIASLQVTETLKYLTGNINSLADSMTYVDVWQNQFQQVKLPERNLRCTCCGERIFASLNSTSSSLTVSFCGRRTIQIRPEASLSVSLSHIAEKLSPLGDVRYNESLLRCDFGEQQITLFRDGRALIHGVEDVAIARSMYARYIGM